MALGNTPTREGPKNAGETLNACKKKIPVKKKPWKKHLGGEKTNPNR